MKSDLVNILLTTYNGEHFLSEQIDSILKQTHSNIKILARDDGSTDNTVKILNEYQDKYPDKFQIIPTSSKNAGAAMNFFTLISYADAPYIMFCDQDDYWLPEKISKSLFELKEMESEFGKQMPLLVHTNLKVVDQNLRLIHPSFWEYSGIKPENTRLNRLLVQNVITGCTVIFNRCLANLCQTIPDNLLMHDWWLGLITSAIGEIRHIEEPTVFYRQHYKNAVGAKASIKSLSELNKKIVTTFTRPKGYLPDYIHQAENLFFIFQDHLPDKNKEILKNFINLKDQNFFQKRINLIKHGFLKGKTIQAIGQVIRF